MIKNINLIEIDGKDSQRTMINHLPLKFLIWAFIDLFYPFQALLSTFNIFCDFVYASLSKPTRF